MYLLTVDRFFAKNNPSNFLFMFRAKAKEQIAFFLSIQFHGLGMLFCFLTKIHFDDLLKINERLAS